MLDDAGIAEVLRSARRIAVIGASSRESRPSFGVFRYLVHQGYECVPVNPGERDVLGIAAFRTLGEAVAATGPFDIVDVFRRSELCLPHAVEAVEVGARCLWLQLGVVNWEAARIAHAAGLSVVMDRCTAIGRRIRERCLRQDAPGGQRTREHEHQPDDRDRRVAGLAAQDLHRDRRPGR
jgi:predicted CoA-binding protein